MWILKLSRTITVVLLERGTMTQGIKYSGREEERLGELQTTTRSSTRRQNAYDMRAKSKEIFTRV